MIQVRNTEFIIGVNYYKYIGWLRYMYANKIP